MRRIESIVNRRIHLALISSAVGAVKSPAQHAGDKEENAVDDGKDPASLEHGAVLVKVGTPLAAARVVVMTDLNTNGNANARAVGIGDTSVHIDTSDEGTDKANVNDSDEWARDVAISVELIEREHRPRASKNGNDEQGEQAIGDSLMILDVWVDEEC